MRFLLIFILVQLPVFLPLAAQEYLINLQHFGVEEGVSHRNVLTVFQDSRGFIWLGTQYGLNRFDGKTFKWYTKERNGLASNHIAFIAEDDVGHLWLFGQENQYSQRQGEYVITIFDIYSEQVIPLEQKIGTNPAFDVDKLTLFFSTPNRTIYFGYDENWFYRYTSRHGLERLAFPEVEGFLMDLFSPRSTIWGLEISQKELIEIDTNGTILQGILGFGISIASGKVLMEDEQGKIWMQVKDSLRLDKQKLYTYHTKQGLHEHIFAAIGDKNNSAHWQASFYGQAKSNLLWYTGPPNFFAINIENGSLIDFSQEFPLMASGVTNHLFFDQDSTAWAGTENGLYQIQLKRSPFTRYLYKDPDESALADLYSSRGIVQVGQKLYINCISGKGGQVIDLSTGEFEPLHYKVTYPSGGPVKSQFPKGLYVDRNSNIWFGEGEVIKRDLKTGKDHLFLWEDGVRPAYIWSFFEEANGKKWLGTSPGLAVIDSSNSKIIPYTQYNEYAEFAKQTVYAILEKSPLEILLATSGGVYVLDPEKGIIDRLWTGGAPAKQLPNDIILHIHKDKNEVYWLATGGGGLVKFTFGTGRSIEQVEQFTIADGLSNNNLYAIYEDEVEQLWISSDYGIIQFDKSTNQSKAYLPVDGVSYPEFNRVSHYQATDGRIYFGSINGVTAFYPKEVTKRDEVYNVPLEITRFSQFDKEQNQVVDKTADLVKHQAIILKPGERVFDLSFALLDYKSTQNIRYAYKIDGVDQDWHFLEEGNLRVNGLPYGKFNLTIRGQGSDGRFSVNELHIPINVIAPFYARSWFKWLMGGLAVFLVLGIFKWRTRTLKLRQIELEHQVRERTAQIEKDRKLIGEQYEQLDQQAKELRQLDQLKSRFFANVSHELRTPLTLILGPLSTILKRNTANSKDFPLLKLMQQNGQNLLKLVNEILDLSKLEASTLALNEESVAVYPFVHQLVSQFESHAKHQGIQLVFELEADKRLHLLLDKAKFEKVVNNLLSNAIKFTPKGGEVSCILKDQGNTMQLDVIDSGKGIHPNDLPHVFDRFYQSKQPDAPTQGGTGIGLALCREYTDLFKGKIWVESEWKKGSKFSFQFPKKEVIIVADPEPATVLQDAIPVIAEPAVNAPATEECPTILLVEDNPSLQQYIQLVLQDKYAVIVAQNGQEALNLLSSSDSLSTSGNLPDLIISDVMMPIMDGFQLLEKLKAIDHLRHIPVVMLTARAALKDKLKALRIGVDDYMLKPFETEELEARIANLLQNSRERHTLHQSSIVEEDQAESGKPLLSKADMEWLEKLEGLVKEQMDDSQFGLSQLANQLYISERQLHRRIKKLTGLTPNKYVREIKLQKARILLEDRACATVAEVSYAVGFSKSDYFSKVFQERFGKLPSAYL